MAQRAPQRLEPKRELEREHQRDARDASLSARSENLERFMRINQWNREANVRAVRLDNLIWPLFDFIGVLGSALLIVVGAIQVIEGYTSFGVIAAFINYLWRFWAPISALSRVLHGA